MKIEDISKFADILYGDFAIAMWMVFANFATSNIKYRKHTHAVTFNMNINIWPKIKSCGKCIYLTIYSILF